VEFRVNAFAFVWLTSPAVAMAADGDFVVAWEKRSDGSGLGIYAQRFQTNKPPTTLGIEPVNVNQDLRYL